MENDLPQHLMDLKKVFKSTKGKQRGKRQNPSVVDQTETYSMVQRTTAMAFCWLGTWWLHAKIQPQKAKIP